MWINGILFLIIFLVVLLKVQVLAVITNNLYSGYLCVLVLVCSTAITCVCAVCMRASVSVSECVFSV